MGRASQTLLLLEYTVEEHYARLQEEEGKEGKNGKNTRIGKVLGAHAVPPSSTTRPQTVQP